MSDPRFVPAAAAPNHTNMAVYWQAADGNWHIIQTIDNSIIPPDPQIWTLVNSTSRGEVTAFNRDQKVRPTLAFNAYDYAPNSAMDPRLIDFVTGQGVGGALSPVTATEVPGPVGVALCNIKIRIDATSPGARAVETIAYGVYMVPAAPAPANTGMTRAWTGTVYGVLTTSAV